MLLINIPTPDFLLSFFALGLELPEPCLQSIWQGLDFFWLAHFISMPLKHVIANEHMLHPGHSLDRLPRFSVQLHQYVYFQDDMHLCFEIYLNGGRCETFEIRTTQKIGQTQFMSWRMSGFPHTYRSCSSWTKKGISIVHAYANLNLILKQLVDCGWKNKSGNCMDYYRLNSGLSLLTESEHFRVFILITKPLGNALAEFHITDSNALEFVDNVTTLPELLSEQTWLDRVMTAIRDL